MRRIRIFEDRSPNPHSKSLVRRIIRRRHCYLLLIPTIAMLIIFKYYPAYSAIYHSFFNWDGYTPGKFIGLANFREMFLKDPIMRIAAINIVKLTGLRVLIALTVPLLAAEMIFHLKNLRAAYIYRIVFVVPMVVPAMVVLLIWKFVYDPYLGVLNQFLKTVGLRALTRPWLGDYNLALYSILFVGFPWVSGFALLIYLAGLQNIPESILDSARIDGASAFTRFWRIDLPLIVAQIKLILILTIINGLQGYVGIMILTNGGPGDATMVPGLHLYNNGFNYNRMGYACAIGTALFVLIFTLTYINSRYIKSSVEYEAV
ncbi:MAG: carbohydrate ABC transporter permease [bacterium]